MERPKETLKSSLRLSSPPGSQEYVDELSSVDTLHQMLVFNSVYRVKQAASKLSSAVMSKMDLSTAWNRKAGISLIDSA